MNAHKQKRHSMPWAISLSGLILLTGILLSGCRGLDLAQPEMPDDGPPPAVSLGAAVHFIEKVIAAGETAVDTDRFTISVTQEEMTSFLAIGSELTERLQGLQDIENLGEIEGLEGTVDTDDLEAWQQLVEKYNSASDAKLPDLSLRLVIEEP
jgi:hypothetical protein